MSVRYEVVRLVLRLRVALGLALGVAGVAAVVRGGTYLRALELSCYVIAALLFVLAAAGNSPGRSHALDVESGLAGSSTWRPTLGDPANPPSKALAPAVPFLFSTVALILIGLALAPA
jgi:drug/metabolite transporter (DMT)-like permease